jgi:hypothetical protein
MNKRIVLASYPEGWVTDANFRLETAPMPKPAEGEVLVKNLWLSLDPYMRGRMSQQKSYVKGVEPGDVMTGETAGEVVESKDPKFKPGDKVTAPAGWQLFWSGKADLLTKVDASKVPLSYFLGCLGMPGRTAWFGMKEICAPKPGETVVVSAASGAVGSVVGQLAKAWGCRAVGIAGGKAKCDYVVKDLGFDACVDYKAGNLLDNLKAACPKGVDAYFENVGGEILDTVLLQMNLFGRIPVCGLISAYNATSVPEGPKNLRAVLTQRLRMQGLIVFDWANRVPEAIAQLGAWHKDGKLKIKEDVREGGLDAFPDVLNLLYTGGNMGKLVLKV